MSSYDDERKQIESRYRAYCDVCQAGQLDQLRDFWSVPALFTMDVGKPEPFHKLVQTYAELEELYGQEFGASTGVDKTTIDASNVQLFGNSVATIETQLSHTAKGALHDRQHASYGCRKVDGLWFFISHVSEVTKG